jgi:SAM-dependent methyltransferase
LLATNGWSVTGLDVDPQVVAAAKSRVQGGDFRVVRPDADALPAADGSVSLLLCIEVQPVIESTWFLPEAHRVLVHDGRLVAVVWNKLSLRGLFANAISRIRERRPHPFYRRSYREWRGGLTSLGMVVEEEIGICWGPFSRASDSPLVDLAISVEKSLRLGRLPSISPWVLVTARRA